MSNHGDEILAIRQTFRRLFDDRKDHVALLDLEGVVLETNYAWREFGRNNGLTWSLDCVGRNYLQVCEQAAVSKSPGAEQAYLGMLEVIHTRRPKFTMIYPCHSPTERRWYRMWVQPQMPAVAAVVVAHHRFNEYSIAIRGLGSSFGTSVGTSDAIASASMIGPEI